MLQATVHPVRAHHKEKKPPGASVEHNSAFEYWNHELDSTYTTTAFDEFPSHLTTKSSDSTGLPQLSGEQYAQFSSRGLEQQTVARDDVRSCPIPRHSPHHSGDQQSEVSMRYLSQDHTRKNSECSLAIETTSYGPFLGEFETGTTSPRSPLHRFV
jgi:hypothetical protein